MIKGCYDCVIKHLGYAEAAAVETVMGYPSFERKVVGNLAHAAEEIMEFRMDLALVIREHRLNWVADKRYRVPYDALTAFVQVLRASEPQTVADYEIPDGCLTGISLNDDGAPVYSMDTRP